MVFLTALTPLNFVLSGSFIDSIIVFFAASISFAKAKAGKQLRTAANINFFTSLSPSIKDRGIVADGALLATKKPAAKRVGFTIFNLRQWRRLSYVSAVDQVAQSLDTVGVVSERLNLLRRVRRLVQEELAELFSFKVVLVSDAADFVR